MFAWTLHFASSTCVRHLTLGHEWTLDASFFTKKMCRFFQKVDKSDTASLSDTRYLNIGMTESK